MPASRAILRQVYESWSPGLQPTWTVDQVRSALSAHESGQFSSSAMLVDAMGRDDRITAVLNTRVNGLLGLPFDLKASDEDDSAAVALAEELGAQWPTMVPREQLAKLLGWRIMLGIAVAELRWARTASRWTPELHVWHPQWLYQDDGRDCLVIQTKQDSNVVVEPGDGKWVVVQRGDRGWMDGAVRALAIPWLVRQFALRDWARYSEKHGHPLVLAKFPAVSSDDEKDDYVSAITDLSNETTVALPQGVQGDIGFDLELLETKDQSWEGFERLISQVNTAMAVHLLGQNLTTEVQGGAYAAAQVHDRVRLDYLESDACEMSETLQDQLLRPMVSVNYGPPSLERLPEPEWDTAPPEDTKLTAETVKTFGEAISAVKGGGFTISNLDELAEKYGLELEEKEPEPIPAGLAPFARPGQPPQPPQSAPEGDEEQDLSEVALASGDAASAAPGFAKGQLYADALADEGVRRTSAALAPDIRAIRAAIDSSQDYGEVREKLLAVYRDMHPDKFARLMEKALILGNLAGRWAVTEDL